MRLVVLVGLCAARFAWAEPVDLLHAVPATVAVSSTVDNAKILPAHLVDGKLETAWNSRTNDLVGAWIAVRLPANVKVTAVRLTVGFTKQDKKLGDLFLENPRIKKVRVTHDKTTIDKVLDIENRGVQEIPIAGEGGDYKVEVLEVQMGTKTTWRETCVSELSIWGTTATPAAKPTRPTVQIGSLEPVSERDCIHALFSDAKSNKLADDDLVGRVEIYPAGNDRYLCHVPHGEKPDKADDGIRTHELAIVTAKHELLDDHVQELTHGGPYQVGPDAPDPDSPSRESGDVTVTPIALTATETAFEVDVTQSVSGPMLGDDHVESTIYRVTGAGLVAVLKFKSWESGGESTDSDRCKLAVGKAGKTLPELELHCTAMSGRFHHERANEIESNDRVERYRWAGSKYVKR